MASGMTAVKMAISLPEEAVQRVRNAVRAGRAPSASAFIAQAIAQQTTRDELRAMLAEMLVASGGPASAAETREIDRELGVRPRRRVRG